VYGKNTPYGWEEEYDTIDRSPALTWPAFTALFLPRQHDAGGLGDFSAPEDEGPSGEAVRRLDRGTAALRPFRGFGQTRRGHILASKSDVTQTSSRWGNWAACSRTRTTRLEIMADILGGGFQSRLFRRVRTRWERLRDWSRLGANYDHLACSSSRGAQIVSTVETSGRSSRKWSVFRSTQVSEEELKTAKDTALNSLVFAFDTSQNAGPHPQLRVLTDTRDFIQQYQRALKP